VDNSKLLNPYYHALEKGELVTVEPVELTNSCFFEHHEDALLLLKNTLGYNPQYRDYAPLMPFLRTYLEQYKTKQIPDTDFISNVSVVIKQIRNGQMQAENRTREFNNSDFETYFREAKEHKHKARKLLTDMLGFEPKNIHSLEAEMFLRNYYFTDSNVELQDYLPLAYYAATITLYRFNYMEHGEAVANDTPLLGLEIPSKRNLAEA
jgi:hypothetical protein